MNHKQTNKNCTNVSIPTQSSIYYFRYIIIMFKKKKFLSKFKLRFEMTKHFIIIIIIIIAVPKQKQKQL